MEVGALLVGEEQVGLPEAFEHLGVHGQRVGLEVLRQPEPRVVPALPQEDVHAVVLQGNTTTQRVSAGLALARLTTLRRQSLEDDERVDGG